MKRYRLVKFEFDTRCTILTQQLPVDADENVKRMHTENVVKLREELQNEYGSTAVEIKIRNFSDVGPKPFSLVAFHNRFLEQIRRAFVIRGYYPALTAACALGERILNHLMRTLRDDFRTTPEYKHVYNKDSFQDWNRAIDILESWGVLLPEVVKDFRDLCEVRNQVIHFDPETEGNERSLALEAIQLLSRIIAIQFGFGAYGTRPWLIPGVRGEFYVKKEAETDPFVRKIVLPSCKLVGPFNSVIGFGPSGMMLEDDHEYEEREVTDEEFCLMRRKGKAADVRRPADEAEQRNGMPS